MGQKGKHRITDRRELIQLDLYDKWPEFEYVTVPHLVGKKRHVKPGSPHQGAKYLIVSDNLTPHYPVSPNARRFLAGTSQVSNPLLHHRNLGTELVAAFRQSRHEGIDGG